MRIGDAVWREYKMAISWGKVKHRQGPAHLVWSQTVGSGSCLRDIEDARSGGRTSGPSEEEGRKWPSLAVVVRVQRMSAERTAGSALRVRLSAGVRGGDLSRPARGAKRTATAER